LIFSFFKCAHIFTSSVLLFPVYSAQRICESVKCNFSLLSFSLPSLVKYCRLVCGCCWELASLLFCSWEYQIDSLRARQRKKLFWSRNYLLLVTPVVIFQIYPLFTKTRVQKWTRVEWVCTGFYMCLLSSSCCCIVKQIWGL